MTITWSSSQKATAITLDGTLLIASNSTAANESVVATTFVTGRKIYFEVNVTASGASHQGVGIAMSTSTCAAAGGGFAGQDTLSMSCVNADQVGNVFYNGAAFTTAVNWTTPGLCCCAVDQPNSLIYWRSGAAGAWNPLVGAGGNPATQTGGVAIQAGLVGQAVAPALTLNWTSGATASATANFAASSWSGVAPAGFGPVDLGGCGSLPLTFVGCSVGWRVSLLAAGAWRAGKAIERNCVITRRGLILPSRHSLIGHNGGPSLDE